jgi:TfoX/Sxy family transcriptional regulator of competence genes
MNYKASENLIRHNKSLQSDARKSPRAAELKRYTQ